MKDIEEVTPPGAPKQTTRLEVLLDNYRESRTEGMELARSVFTDILIIAGFLGAIIGGELLTDNQRILFFLPLVLLVIALYAVQKFKISSLVTSYMIYLENEINLELGSTVMIWNSQLVGKHFSAGRRSLSGNTILVILILLYSGIYAVVCTWVYFENEAYFSTRPSGWILFASICGVILLINGVALINVMKDIRNLTPDYIQSLTIRTEY